MKNREIKFRIWDTENKQWITDYEMDAISSWSEPLNNIFKQKGAIFQEFTGLKDKNGKEIYEGDIIKLNNNYIVKIHCENLFTGCEFKTHNNQFIITRGKNTLEIIGNIFENPDLIK